MKTITKRLLGITALSVGIAVTTAGIASASTAPALTGWTQTGTSTVVSLTGGEGVATAADGSVHYAGSGIIPLKQRVENWTHIGDPDITQGYRFDAYQNSSSTAGSKMYLVTTPSGAKYEYTHSLLSGEAYNNSFDTVSPDGQWMVSGEWNDMNRLLVFPTPILNSSTPKTGGALTAAGQITLDHPVRDVQGCDFVSATRLLCSTDDPNTDLFPTAKQLLQVDLPAPLSGAPVTGHVTSLGELPMKSTCNGTYETEGIDYYAPTQTLRVEVIPPPICGDLVTTVYKFQPTS